MNRLDRPILAAFSLATLALATPAWADITAAFDLAGSTIDVDLGDNNGIVQGADTFSNAGGIFFATGELVEIANASGFRLGGTTSGGVDDPTRGSSSNTAGTIGEAATLSIDLAADLRLVNNGTGTLVSLVQFEIFSDSTDPLPYEIAQTGIAFGPLTAVSGTIFGDGTLSPGVYSVLISLSVADASTWSLRIVPAPGSAALGLAGLGLVGRRRR
ncbi:MAG: hypothetical protein RBS39_02710 [Phycisphaerales bacterium]|nr:hypothetical protein [Phycisphaerales bacterium]